MPITTDINVLIDHSINECCQVSVFLQVDWQLIPFLILQVILCLLKQIKINHYGKFYTYGPWLANVCFILSGSPEDPGNGALDAQFA